MITKSSIIHQYLDVLNVSISLKFIVKLCIIKVSLGGLNLFLLSLLRLLAVFPQSNRIVVFHNDDDDEDRLGIGAA